MSGRSRLLRTIMIGSAAALILAGCATMASERVSSARHPNLAQAQTFIESAMSRITAAQQANEFDMGGHAARAKDLLGQAYVEIKLAAEAADRK